MISKFFLAIIFGSIAVIVLIGYGSQAFASPELKEIKAEFEIERTLAEQENERAKREIWQNASMNVAQGAAAAAAMTGVLINIGILVIGVAMLSLGTFVARWALKPELIPFKDGMAAIVARNTRPWWKFWGPPEITYANPNQFAAPFVKVINERDGGMRTLTDTTGMTTEELLEAHRGGQQIQKVQAGWRPKEVAPSKWEVIRDAGLLGQALPQRREPSTELALPREVRPKLTLREAIARSNVKDGFIIGQEVDTNEPCLALPRSTAHFSLLGASQQGKTTTATTFVAELHAAGFHVIVLDPEAEGYWQIFKNHAEVVETGGEELLFHLECINEEYKRRGRLLNEQGVNHYNRLTDPPPRVMLVIEEFSELIKESANLSPDHGRVLEILELMARRYAKRGVHLFLLDQHYGKWPRPLLENVSWRATHRQGKKDWSLANYDAIDMLPLGHFAHNGQMYESFRADLEIMAVLAELPRFGYERIIREQVNTVNTVNDPPPMRPMEGGGDRDVPALPPFLLALLGDSGKVVNTAVDSSEWDELAALLFARKPQTTQAELCRVLAAADPQGREPRNFSGKLSMDLFHCYSPNGDPKKVQTAKRKAIYNERH